MMNVYGFLLDACDNEFSESEIIVLYNLMVAQVPSAIESDIKCYDYLSHKYAEMKMQDERRN